MLSTQIPILAMMVEVRLMLFIDYIFSKCRGLQGQGKQGYYIQTPASVMIVVVFLLRWDD